MKSNKYTLAGAIVIIIAIAVIIVFASSFGGDPSDLSLTDNTETNNTEENQNTNSVSQTESEVEPVENVTAVIDIADYGTITVELDGSAAPITVTNFKNLVESGFYDGLTFHRIMEGFMMQGGDPLGNGTGGSDENIKGEFSSNGVNNPLSHTKGAISMARSQMPDSASSQFFICHEDATFLDGNYACFGYVTDGMDVVDAVCTKAEPIDDNGTIPKEKQPVINSITIK